jgi:hypothetical protein
MDQVTFEIIEKFGNLSTSNNGWNRELNLVSWNGGNPKYDLRDWSPDEKKMSKGITLTLQEIMTLKNLIEMVE